MRSTPIWKRKTMTSKSLIVKDNRLIEASYRLDLAEQRLILMAITHAREAGIKITASEWLEVSAKDYAALYDVSHSRAYRALKATADSLFERQVSLQGIDEKTQKEGVIKTRWVSACLYVDNAAVVRMQFTPVIIGYILNLEKCFTSYAIKNISQMSSSYAIRLYELMKQYKGLGERYIALGDLKEKLGATEKSYDRLSNFKNKVLDVSLEQVNRFTDIQVYVVPRKSGREIIGYDFEIIDDQSQPTDPKPKKPTSKAAKPSPPISLTTAERNMLKAIQAKNPEVSLDTVKAICVEKGIDPFMALIGLDA